MTNIAVLKSKILRMHLAFKDLTMLSVKSILQDLQVGFFHVSSVHSNFAFSNVLLQKI